MNLSDVWASSKEWLIGLWNAWRGAILLAAIFVVICVVAWAYVPTPDGGGSAGKTSKVAMVIVAAFTAYGCALVVTFFGVFRGIKADEGQLTSIITYCYAFIVFSLSASMLPFVALPLIPGLYDMMVKSPIGIVAGCSLPITTEPEEKNVPKELRCGVNTDQWIVNIGGTTVRDVSVRPSTQGTPPLQKQPSETATQESAPKPQASPARVSASAGESSVQLVQVRGGLVVPLYAVVLALMGAAVSMTRRVPEFQRRLTPGDQEYMTYDQAREALVFQIMQVASAPLIVLTAYYLIEPGTRASTIVLSFASGFSSETVLLLIRAILEKLKPAPAAPPSRQPGIRVAPARLDFGNVTVEQTNTKAVTISNSGNAQLVISGLTCTGEFTHATQVPFTIGPASSGSVNVEFRPTNQGNKQGQLMITDNAAGSPRTVDLTGTGI